mmetsp:Transcript_6866/g.15697  ORF Transcript_6866/g.15697 Transcript_6866/m.15697 type:complete len:202 (+) Transcript_6866:82-687(+)
MFCNAMNRVFPRILQDRHLFHVREATTQCLHGVEGTIPFRGQGIAIAQYAEVKHRFTQADVDQFAALSGDLNRIHTPLEWEAEVENFPELTHLKEAGVVRLQQDGKTTETLVHGMLVASLFSRIFGTIVPGSVYRSQTLSFRAPVFVHQEVTARMEVLKVKVSPRGGVIIVTDSTVFVDGRLCIEGEASAWLPKGEKDHTS